MVCIFDNFVLGNDNLQFVNSFKYLGHSLTDDLHDDNDDMLKQMNQLYGRTNMLIEDLQNVVYLSNVAFSKLILLCKFLWYGKITAS